MFLNLKYNKNCSVVSSIVHSWKKEVKDNHQHIFYLLKTTLYLAKQGVSFRGQARVKNHQTVVNFKLLNIFSDINFKLKL